MGRDRTLHAWLVFDEREMRLMIIAVSPNKLWVMKMLYD